LVFQSTGSVDTSQVQGLYLNEAAHKFSCIAEKISNKSGAITIFLEKVTNLNHSLAMWEMVDHSKDTSKNPQYISMTVIFLNCDKIPYSFCLKKLGFHFKTEKQLCELQLATSKATLCSKL
jgi:hypothetical protein